MFKRKKLYKSLTNSWLAGVCGGIGEYLTIDPNIIRLIFVLASFFGFFGVFAYLILAVIIPNRPY